MFDYELACTTSEVREATVAGIFPEKSKESSEKIFSFYFKSYPIRAKCARCICSGPEVTLSEVEKPIEGLATFSHTGPLCHRYTALIRSVEHTTETRLPAYFYEVCKECSVNKKTTMQSILDT